MSWCSFLHRRLAILAAFTVTLLVGGRAAIEGALAVGLFSTLVFMTQRLLWPLTRMGEVMDLYQAGGRLGRPHPRPVGGATRHPPGSSGAGRALVRGAVRFDRVDFAYGATAAAPGERPEAHPVLSGFDLDIRRRNPRPRRHHRGG